MSPLTRILALDVGEKRIGVALSDPLGYTAQGLEVLPREGDNDEAVWQRIKELVEHYGVERILLGLPRNLDGSFGPQAALVQAFGEGLAHWLKTQGEAIPLCYWDERLSTRTAERGLIAADLSRKKRRRVVDKVAAVVILQGYLDFLRRNKE